MSGTQLRRLRLINNYTQKDLAKKLGVSRQALCMWESNKREIKIGFLKKMAKLFKVSVDEIINFNKTINTKKEKGEMKRKTASSSSTDKVKSDMKKTVKTKEMKIQPKSKPVKAKKDKVVKKPKKIQIKLNAPKANNVLLIGDFNAWDINGVKMEKTKRGTWKTDLYVEPGRYEYKFIVDNEWWTDPENVNVVWNNLGSQNSFFDLN